MSEKNPTLKAVKRGRMGDIAFLYAFTSIAVVLILWQLITMFTDFGKVFPSPIGVLQLFFLSIFEPIGAHTLLVHLSWTIGRILMGFFIGGILGNITGLAMGSSKTINAIIKPVFEVLRPIPGIAWIPLAILWFGIDEGSKYFIITISTFVICTLNSHAGADRVSPVLIGASKMLGAKDRQVFMKITLPSSLPQIFAGLQIALSTACNTVLAAEMVRSSEGAGWLIIKGMEIGDMTRIMVGIISISVSGMLMATVLRAIERRAVAWNNRGA